MAKMKYVFFHRCRLNRSAEETHPYSEIKTNNCCHTLVFLWKKMVFKIFFNSVFHFEFGESSAPSGERCEF